MIVNIFLSNGAAGTQHRFVQTAFVFVIPGIFLFAAHHGGKAEQHVVVEVGGGKMLLRKIQSYIEKHLLSDSNKILVIDGARQIGKTYIIKYTAEKLYKNYMA